MRYAVIMAGGSGTRLWPMSRSGLPKQLIPLIDGRSLLQIAMDRMGNLIAPEQVFICAGQTHRQPILDSIHETDEDRYLGEPVGRDTLNAVGFATAVISKQDPDAVIAIFTADHIIEPVDDFQQIVARGYQLAEARPDTLVTFGIRPTHPATGYGYLELGQTVDQAASPDRKDDSSPRVVNQFKEKPDEPTARRYVAAGPDRYLWNSGMFVWQGQTLLRCIEQYEPANFNALRQIANAWGTGSQAEVLERIYPALKKISVDYAVMEPASRDPDVTVAAVPMPLRWLDIGSWPAFAQTCHTDEDGNAVAAKQHLTVDCRDSLLASSDPQHLVTAIGCDNLLIVHTPDATLVCRADRAEDIKKIHAMVSEKYGAERV